MTSCVLRSLLNNKKKKECQSFSIQILLVSLHANKHQMYKVHCHTAQVGKVPTASTKGQINFLQNRKQDTDLLLCEL